MRYFSIVFLCKYALDDMCDHCTHVHIFANEYPRILDAIKLKKSNFKHAASLINVCSKTVDQSEDPGGQDKLCKLLLQSPIHA